MDVRRIESSASGARLDQTTAEIKQAVDIVDVIGEHVTLEPSSGAKFRGLCPFHDDHKPSMDVDRVRQHFRCWACGEKGDVFDFLVLYERLDFSEAKQRLADRAGITLRKGNTVRNDRSQSLFETLLWAQEEFQKCLFEQRTGADARQYLKDRGISEGTARRFGLGIAPDNFGWLLDRAERAGIETDRLVRADLAKPGNRGIAYDTFRGRLMFPIRDERGRVVGFAGRILPSSKSRDDRKYVNTSTTEVYNKSELLYGLDVAGPELRRAQRGAKTLVVMEGYTDCLMSYQAGFLTAVATCGTALTGGQLRKMRLFAERVVLMFDGDAMGQKAAREATTLFLSEEVDLRLCVLPDGLDPCDFVRQQGVEALREAVDQAPDALDFLITGALTGMEAGTLEDRRVTMDQVLTTLANVPLAARAKQTIKYDLAVNRLGQSFGVGERVLRERVEELRSQKVNRRVPPADAEAAPTPMDERERWVVRWLVAQPGRAGEIMPLFLAEKVAHSDLQRLTLACYELYRRFGEESNLESLREQIDDSELWSLVLDLVKGVPTGEAFDQGLEDIKAMLVRSRRRAEKSASVLRSQISLGAEEQEHLELLRQWSEQG